MMTDNKQKYIRDDGSLEIFDALENGQALQRQAIRISLSSIVSKFVTWLRQPRHIADVSKPELR